MFPNDPLEILPRAMAVPMYVSEEVAVGRSVFHHFVHEEFQVEGVEDEEIFEEVPEDETLANLNTAAPQYADRNLNIAMGHIGIDSRSVAIEVGASIREIANDFAKSRERERLRRQAERIDFNNINYDGFFALCEEVFSRGFTRENVVALFYFCADVLIKCVKSKMRDVGVRLFRWALQFIVDRVCAWVLSHGGWQNAVRNTLSMRQMAALSAGAVAIAAFSGFILYKCYT